MFFLYLDIIVELEVNLEERRKRNISSNRLEHNPSKRNIEWPEKILKMKVGLA